MLASHDYNIFTHMMFSQKHRTPTSSERFLSENIQILTHFQALELMEALYGLIPAVLLPGGPQDMGKANNGDQEQLIMVEVIR